MIFHNRPTCRHNVCKADLSVEKSGNSGLVGRVQHGAGRAAATGDLFA